MIQGISAGYMPLQTSQTSKITSEQNDELKSFLDSYDTDSLSETDAKEIVSEIKDMGITQGAELTTVLAESGIDAKELADQAGIGGPDGKDGPPPPPPPGGGGKGRESVDDAVVSLISDAVSAYESSDEAESIWSLLQPALEEAGYDTSGPVIDFYA